MILLLLLGSVITHPQIFGTLYEAEYDDNAHSNGYIIRLAAISLAARLMNVASWTMPVTGIRVEEMESLGSEVPRMTINHPPF